MALAQVYEAVIAGMIGTIVTIDVRIHPRCGHVRELIEVHRPLRDEVP